MDCRNKAAMIRGDFFIPSGGDYYYLLKCLEGEPGHVYNVKRQLQAANADRILLHVREAACEEDEGPQQHE
jgi:hypothetical protein